MNTTLIFGPLAFLSIFYTSVQGDFWLLASAEVGNQLYINSVSLERKDDGKTYLIHAIPLNSHSTVPEIVHGPFELRGFGPYSMLMRKMWLNTDEYVSVSFFDITEALKFYHVLNPHHWPSFRHHFKIKELISYSPDGSRMTKVDENELKALDIFVLEAPDRSDSKARSYVVHKMEGDQEPIVIFHSLEHKMTVDGDAIEVTMDPRNSPIKHRLRMEFEDPAVAKDILEARKVLTSLGFEYNLQDLEALLRNTYPTRPPFELGESSTAGQHRSGEN